MGMSAIDKMQEEGTLDRFVFDLQNNEADAEFVKHCPSDYGLEDMGNCGPPANECEQCMKRALTKEYEEAENGSKDHTTKIEDGRMIELPNSDWADLITQIATIVENDFTVYRNGKKYSVKNMHYFDDVEFSFDADCIHIIPDSYGVERSDFYSCDGEDKNCEHCGMSFDQYKFYGEEPSMEQCGCSIHFRYSDIGKTLFLTKEAAQAALQEQSNDEA